MCVPEITFMLFVFLIFFKEQKFLILTKSNLFIFLPQLTGFWCPKIFAQTKVAKTFCVLVWVLHLEWLFTYTLQVTDPVVLHKATQVLRQHLVASLLCLHWVPRHSYWKSTACLRICFWTPNPTPGTWCVCPLAGTAPPRWLWPHLRRRRFSNLRRASTLPTRALLTEAVSSRSGPVLPLEISIWT